MDRNSMVLASLLILLAVALSLADSAAGDMRAVTAGGKRVHHGVDAAVRHAADGEEVETRLEDVIAPELGSDLELHHRRILGEDTHIVNSVLKGDQAGCIGPCPPPGFPYNPPGRGCNRKYGCKNGYNPPDLQK